MTAKHERPVAAARPYVQQPRPEHARHPGTEAVLYAGPDAVLLMILAAIRDGRYEDIHAYADEAQHAIHARFDAVQRHARRTLAPAVRAWQRADAARKGQVAA